MAKKNSTKTATKEAMQASEPRLQAFTGWQGINIEQTPLEWSDSPQTWGDASTQTDLQPNYLLVQNNVDTESNGTLQTRKAERILTLPPAGTQFTGVAWLKNDILFAVCNDTIQFKHLSDPSSNWKKVSIDAFVNSGGWSKKDLTNGAGAYFEWSCIYTYCVNGVDNLICMAKNKTNSDQSTMFTGNLWSVVNQSGHISNTRTIATPTTKPTHVDHGVVAGSTADTVSVCSIVYSYVNKYGMTPLSHNNPLVVNLAMSPVDWTMKKYLEIRLSGIPQDQGIIGVSFYCMLDNAASPIFIGYCDVSSSSVTLNWYGSMADVYEWSNANLSPSGVNTTLGVPASRCRQHDGRMYFWGNKDRPYRLYIGGDSGNELTEEQGLGGDYIDIEPGTGVVIHGTYKFKTASGAGIVTILCGNPNTNMVKRYNLVNTTITVSNELVQQSYMPEEVSNVVGCNSEYGAGVWADGLYALSRYGLTVTTQQMEYSSQLQSTIVSDPIKPVFTDRLATKFSDARMIYVNRCIYFALSGEDEQLDHVIFCYDLDAKAWYTYTFAAEDTEILHLMNIDYEGMDEGIGIMSKDRLSIIPTTGDDGEEVEFLLETGELTAKQPTSSTTYVSQIEFRWDYFVGDCTIHLEGVDHYGRRVQVMKRVHEDEVSHDHIEWMRVDYLLENYHIRIFGKARFRLTHWIAKVYPQSNKIGLVYGFNDRSAYINRHNGVSYQHHYIKDYNNLKETILT